MKTFLTIVGLTYLAACVLLAATVAAVAISSPMVPAWICGASMLGAVASGSMFAELARGMCHAGTSTCHQ